MPIYPKHILTIEQQLQALKDAGMQISSDEDAISALSSIGYYRLRGYCFQSYSNGDKKYAEGTEFSNVLKLYQFDTEFSHLLFGMTSAIEVSLRAHLIDALLNTYQDALALYRPDVFEDKELYWKNLGVTCNDIARSDDVFIKHNFQNYDGQIPIWAAVEVMSFGNLSKTIKNLKTGAGSASAKLTGNYHYLTKKGKQVSPSVQMLCSWIRSVVVLRNICAHNSRIYNRALNVYVQIPTVDQYSQNTRYNGIYHIILAMKYLRPNDQAWTDFESNLANLLEEYKDIVEMSRMNFPADWRKHLKI